MLLVDRAVVGRTAFERLKREHLVQEALGAWAFPSDIPVTRALRALVVAPLIPHNAWLSGLAVLWLEGHAAAPTSLDLVAPRGAHRIPPVAGSPPLRLHAGSLLGVRDAAFPRAVSVTRACVDSLWHNPASLAMPATASAIRAGETSGPALTAMVSSFDVRMAGRSRVISLVNALTAA